MTGRLDRLYTEKDLTDADTNPEECCDFSKEYPTVWEFLTHQRLGGKKRTTGTILVFWEEGKAKGCVTDRHHQRSCFVTADTYADLFRVLEEGLGGNTLEWRSKKKYDGPWSNGKGKA